MSPVRDILFLLQDFRISLHVKCTPSCGPPTHSHTHSAGSETLGLTHKLSEYLHPEVRAEWWSSFHSLTECETHYPTVNKQTNEWINAERCFSINSTSEIIFLIVNFQLSEIVVTLLLLIKIFTIFSSLKPIESQSMPYFAQTVVANKAPVWFSTGMGC